MKVKRKTGVLVIAGPADVNRPAWMSEVKSLLSRGHEVHLYLIDRGVLHMIEEDFLALRSGGLRLYACAYGSIRYGVPLTKHAVFCGLTVLSGILKGCEQMVTIPPTHVGCGYDPIWPSSGREPISSNGGKDIVVFIRWSPADSHLPVEGLRIASGLTVGESPIKICLSRETSPLLYLNSDKIVDGERRDGYLAILERAEAIFFSEGNPPGNGSAKARAIDAPGREKLMSEAHRLVVI